MKDKDYSAANTENAGQICARIQEECEAEIGQIIGKARMEKERIMDEAKREIDKKKSQLLRDSDKQIEMIKDRIFSTLDLEKRRAILEEKNAFAEDVFKRVKKYADDFRLSKDYPAFLKASIIEGIIIVDDAAVEIQYSAKDSSIVNGEFIKDVERQAKSRMNKAVSLLFKKGDFDDIGVVVKSHNGRIIFDDTFLARLRRSYDSIYMNMIKEAF